MKQIGGGRYNKLTGRFDVPFYKNKYSWITAVLLFLTAVLVGNAHLSAQMGAFQGMILGGWIFGTLSFIWSATIGVFFSLANKWHKQSTGFWKAFTPIVLMLILDVAALVLFFWAGIILMFYMLGVFRIIVPYLIGYLLSNWVFQGFSSEEFMRNWSNLQMRRSVQYTEVHTHPTEPPNPPTTQQGQYGAYNPSQSLTGRSDKHLTDGYDSQDHYYY